MGNLDNSAVSHQTPGTSRVQVVGLSPANKSGSKKHGSRIRDPNLIPRINQYLNDNKDQAFVSVNDMVDALRQKHREYRRRNWGQFKILVERAFKVVSKKAGMLEPNLSESSCSEIEECNDTDETHAVNNSNSQLKNLYQSSRNDRSSNCASDLELINLSSDDEPSRKENAAGTSSPNERNKLPLPRHINSELTVIRRRAPPEKKSKEGTVSVTFSDFGGSSNVLQEVCKLILHMKHPEVFRTLGVTAPRGFLLHGPPGCGKTLLASAIAGELAIPLIKVSGPELVGGVSGESEERVRELFSSALARAPCVLFIDEVDAITPNRQTAQREMERRIVAQLLTSLDDLALKDENGQVLVIGATKRPDSLDPALRRAGRFDREVCLGIPDEKSRLEILRVLCNKINLSQELDLASLARMTPGFVGADLLSLIREAALVAITRVFDEIQRAPRDPNSRKRKTDSNATLPNPKKPAKELGEIVIEESSKNDVIAEEPAPNKKENTDDATSDKNKEGKKSENVNGTSNEKESDKDDNRKTGKESNEDKSENSNQKEEMDVEAETENENISSTPPPLSSLETLLSWLRNVPKLSAEQLQRCAIQQGDLNSALRTVQPSAKREGFATVPDVSWDDVGSLVSVREHLKMTILGPIKYEAQFERLGLVAPAGVLLCGPPGCGKTLLAKAVANEAGINFISVKGPELLNMYVGESERAVRTVFQRARNSAPCVIFFDELDALCPRRTEGDAGAGMRVVNQMLTEMDGVGERRGVFLMAATNRPDIVDPAVLRPGRLDRTIYIGLPNAEDRKDILLAITKKGTKPPLEGDVCLEAFATRSELENWTGADLAALMREAAMQAVREAMAAPAPEPQLTSSQQNMLVTKAHLEHALRTVRPSVSPSDLIRYEEMRLQFAAVPNLT